jgi:hypothetical protein
MYRIVVCVDFMIMWILNRGSWGGSLARGLLMGKRTSTMTFASVLAVRLIGYGECFKMFIT